MVDEQLIKRCEELETLTQEIEKSVAWQIAIKELEEKIVSLDSCWQSCPQEKLLELQIAKLATLEIINIVDEWRAELVDIKHYS